MFTEQVHYRVLPSGCWEWTRARLKGGYGQVKRGGKTLRAHRMMYEHEHGDIPEGMLVCHTCDNPSCVNPDHLWLGTTGDNVQDKVKKGRQRGAPRGERHPAAKLTQRQAEDVRAEYARGTHTQAELARQYGISQAQVSGIVNNRTYAKENKTPWK